MKKLFTSFSCSINDEIIKLILDRWKKLNPDFEILYFSDKDIKKFFKETKYYKIYKHMKNGVAIADFFRMCYINKYGGYWFDIDIEPIKIDIPKIGNVHLFDLGYKNISYMFIGGKPNQKIFIETINKVSENIKDNLILKKKHVMEITGPRIIQNIICNKLGIENKDGCLIGTDQPKIYLKDSEYEFVYKKLSINNHKTQLYQKLQKKYKKMPYQLYNFI